MSAAAALLGAGLGLSLLLVVAGLVGVSADPPRPRIRAREAVPAGRAALAAGAGIVALAATSWVVGAVLAAAGALFLPRLLGAGTRRGRGIERTEAVAAWTEMLRADMAGAAGIEEAIQASAEHPPDAIAAEVEELAQRIRHQPLETALSEFADAVGDPTADLVVAALVLAARRSGRDLGAALDDAAAAADADAAMRDRVETSRTRSRTAVRIVSLVTVLMAAGLVFLGGEYMEPFDTAEGQVVLLLAGGVFAASLAALARMGEVAVLPRLDLSVPNDEGAPA